MIYLKLAWRNIFRNKRRTSLTALAIGVGVAALIFTDALLIGWEATMIRTATATFMGEGQMHHTLFRETLETSHTIAHPRRQMERLSSHPDIRAVTGRVQTFGMIASPRNVQSIMIYGIDPATESHLSKIDDAVIDGTYLSWGSPTHDGRKEMGKRRQNRKKKEIGKRKTQGKKILIGKKLAEILEVDVGDKITLTAAQAHTGNTAQEMFRIGGIFELGIREMDRSMAFIPLQHAQQLLDIGDALHEIAFTFKDIQLSRNPDHPVWHFADPSNPPPPSMGMEILSWLALMPELKTMLEWLSISMLLMSVILFITVAAGIVNSLFMSLYERTFEFGVLRAVGTRPGNLALLIILESGILGAVSAVVGGVLGAVLIAVFSRVGLDYSDTEFINVAITDRIYPVMEAHQFVTYPLALILFTMIVGIYPALHAANMRPSTAMKRGTF